MAAGGGSSRRPRDMPTKGDRRELEILAASELLLETIGLDAMTMEAIAAEVGITRAALYFYFRSKNDVLTALIGRTLSTLHALQIEPAHDPDHVPTRCIEEIVHDAEVTWRDHGQVVRAAVDLSPTVPEIAELWRSNVARTVEHVHQVLAVAGIVDDDSPSGAERLAECLCWMTERNMYWASKSEVPDAIDRTGASLRVIWLGALPD